MQGYRHELLEVGEYLRPSDEVWDCRVHDWITTVLPLLREGHDTGENFFVSELMPPIRRVIDRSCGEAARYVLVGLGEDILPYDEYWHEDTHCWKKNDITLDIIGYPVVTEKSPPIRRKVWVDLKEGQ